MKNPFIFLVVFVSFFLTNTLQAQLYLQDVSGTPFKETKYNGVEGSSYLFEDWKAGQVKLKNGSVYEGIDIKYDLVKDEVSFKGKNGQQMLFNEPVIEFKFNGNVYLNGVNGDKFFTDKSYLQQLSKGKITVYKKLEKIIAERNEYNSVAKTQIFIEKEEYFYSLDNGPITLLKIDKKFILELLADKRDEMQLIISKNNLKVKEDRDLIVLFNHYNLL